MLTEKNRRLIFNLLGFCLGILGILYGFLCETIFNKLMEKQMVLRPNSEIIDLWKTPPLKVTLDFYIFNWTNPQDFQNLNVKPAFEELGPYRFTEEPNKVAIKWHPENASMTYKKQSKYYFDADGSAGRLDDKIVTVNSLAVSLSSKAKRWSSLHKRVVDIALKIYRDDIAIKKSVDELLFGGYEDVLLNVANFIPSSLIDVKVPFDKFGYCYPRNHSAEVTGIFNIHTGADDLRKFGQIHTWNYRDNTRQYASPCDKVYGSPGEFQSLYLQPHIPIHYFLSDVCRTITLDYVRPTEVEGVKGYRYEGGKRLMDNGTLYPENVCHCNGQCVPSGLMNISSCWFGSPIFLSYPHFHDADPYYLSEVTGLRPEERKHELYLVLEPKTGLVLELAGRLQTNILVEPISDFTMFRNKRRVFFPLFWFDVHTRITPQLANDFKLLPNLIVSGQIFGGICALIGLIILLWYPIKAHLQRHLIQQIRINNLEIESHHIMGKDISTQPEISALLVKTVQDNAKILERADTTLSELSADVSITSADHSSMRSSVSST